MPTWSQLIRHQEWLKENNIKFSKATKDNTVLFNYDISLISEKEITDFCEKGIISEEHKKFINQWKNSQKLNLQFMCFYQNTCVCECDLQPKMRNEDPPIKIYVQFRFFRGKYHNRRAHESNLDSQFRLIEESIDLENNLIASTALRNLLP